MVENKELDLSNEIEVEIETIWLYVESDGFVSGWSSSEIEGGVEVPKTDEMINNWAFYRYVNGEFVKDESKIISSEKESLLTEAREVLERLSEKGVKISVEGTEYLFPYNASNKNYLNKIHDIMEKGYLETATFTFKQDVHDVSIELDKTNIHELWVLSFLHEESSNKTYGIILAEVNAIKTMEDLTRVREKIRAL